LIQNSENMKQENKAKIKEGGSFSLSQSVAVWQLYIIFLRVMGPTSSSRNLPVQKYILFSPIKKMIAFEEFITLRKHSQGR
jgi:hypothetical protein